MFKKKKLNTVISIDIVNLPYKELGIVFLLKVLSNFSNTFLVHFFI
jgi:hypothetical protein